MDGERYIFVGGFPRSGTTLVQNVLDSHSAVYAGPELGMLPAVQTWHREAETHRATGRVDEFFDREGLDAAFRALIDALLLPVADRHGAQLIAEKTPLNVMAFDFLLSLYPGARAVLVVRDPRAVLASNQRVRLNYEARGEAPPAFLRDDRHLMAMMVEVANIGHAARERFGERVHLLRYEDLIAAPEQTARALCAAVGLEFEPAMIVPHEQRHDGARLASELWNPASMFARPIDQAARERWRKDLSPVLAEVMVRAFQDHPLYRGCLKAAS